MSPPRPTNASPVVISTSPLSPHVASPVSTKTWPEVPLTPASSVWIDTLPELVAALKPERSWMLPPYAPAENPPVTLTSPPTSYVWLRPQPAPPLR
eukprot:1181311-Prorocentrum_minimum.AAC.1